MITPLAAGLISFLIDGARTMLIAGTRSSGKTSFLGSLMVEIMRKGRIVTVEDTLEFRCYGFSRVPTLILPSYRPFEAISPKVIFDENYIHQMLNGTILPEDVLHIVELQRREMGIVGNSKLEILLGEK